MMADDMELFSLVERSMETPLDFMLPNSAGDTLWGTPSCKWTYWGGRTNDGFMGGYYLMAAARHPECLEAFPRHTCLLSKATQGALTLWTNALFCLLRFS